MSRTSINQRIKFLLENYKLSVRAFSELIGQKPANTQNYVGARGSMLSADYLKSITEHFEDVNPTWLLTGKSEPFLGGTTISTTITQTQKKVKGPVVRAIHGSVTYTVEECKKERDTYKAECDSLQKQLELLRDQLTMKDQLLAAKNEMLALLRGAYNRPN